MNQVQKQLFRQGSTTFYQASRFFPAGLRQDVFTLYAFLRVADDLVDAVPQRVQEFYDFAGRYRQAWSGQPSNDPIIDPFVQLMRARQIEPAWIEAFLHSMGRDLTQKSYLHHEDLLTYIYGAAEVVGLALNRLMGLPPAADPPARMLGRAMQYINFIRDIKEDVEAGRHYLPLAGSGLADLSWSTVSSQPEEFKHFLRGHTQLYSCYYEQARPGYTFIPARVLVPIQTAMDMYNWTARVIMKDPLIVYRQKVKPSRVRIGLSLLKNLWPAS